MSCLSNEVINGIFRILEKPQGLWQRHASRREGGHAQGVFGRYWQTYRTCAQPEGSCRWRSWSLEAASLDVRVLLPFIYLSNIYFLSWFRFVTLFWPKKVKAAKLEEIHAKMVMKESAPRSTPSDPHTSVPKKPRLSTNVPTVPAIVVSGRSNGAIQSASSSSSHTNGRYRWRDHCLIWTIFLDSLSLRRRTPYEQWITSYHHVHPWALFYIWYSRFCYRWYQMVLCVSRIDYCITAASAVFFLFLFVPLIISLHMGYHLPPYVNLVLV